MKPFEIFRTGRHTSSQGADLTFSDTDVAAIASGYDVALHHAPMVVGHPKQDDPAYGWINGLTLKGDRLVAQPADIDPAFAELVRDKKFRKVSAAFYRPDAANNPKPGSYYLRHVGFLGATAPAVKGLKPIEFAEDADLVVFADVEFGDWRQAWALETIGRLFRGLRDHFVETKDAETAEKLLPEFELGQIVQTAADIRAEERAKLDNAAFSEKTQKGEDMTHQADKARVASLDEREAEIARREATFAERQKQDRATADAAFVGSIVAAGRLPVGLKEVATALFADLGDGELTFSDGAETRKSTPREAFRSLLEKLPVPVITKELAAGEIADFSDPLQVASAISTEIKAAADKGETIDPATAAMRLKKGKA